LIIQTITQPEHQLGSEISEVLASEAAYVKIVLVSAFVALRTILRLREQLLRQVQFGTNLRFTIGIDLGGTSREVLQELLTWNCETFVFHNTISRATFHPKVYLFETATTATLFVGSNNLTDGGFYTNYEAATRYDFELPEDVVEYERLLRPLTPFLNPEGATVLPLDADLIQTLVARGELPSEAEIRQRRREQSQSVNHDGGEIPASPFAPVLTPLPPLLPQNLRAEEPPVAALPELPAEQELHPVVLRPIGVAVWRKFLTPSEALQVNDGTAHVGGVRLTQAKFENPPGQIINQTSYFRRIFADYHWEAETGRHRSVDQEHTFVPMRIIIRGTDYGIHNFEISHKPSGEAEQGNFTTTLRWGREFNPIIQSADLTGAIFSLFETAEANAAFLIDITDT
jgi:HKD family nuclease